MAIPPVAPVPPEAGVKPAGKIRSILLISLSGLLVACLVFLWLTRGSMENLAFLRHNNGGAASFSKKTLVDVSTWQTAQALAALAVTAEETEYAQDAERLADHEVDQAFASALRQARVRVQHRVLTGEALDLSQKVKQLQLLVAQDQQLVKSLTPPPGTAATAAPESDDLDVAKAQLGLDSDELDDAQDDLARASGDDTAQIQDELTAHEASMKAYDNASHSGVQVASVSARQHGTLAGRIQAWFSQQDRYRSILQAQQKAQQDVVALTAEHNKFEAQVNALGAAGAGNPADHAAKLASLKDRSAERQILTIYDDRIQTNQQLASVYGKWAAQIVVQHQIVLHLILRSVALILFILICMLACDALIRRLMSHPALDRRQTQTLRSILQLGIQVLGVIMILLVIFGTPKETPTILGLATAALTVALQDFILAFLGWFILIGKNGLRVGDWVEINGVGGEVVEVGLFSTTLLETGALDEKGYPTGRRISFPNSFAIKGAYFNFSTRGQWMWDDISVTVPSSANTGKMIEKIHAVVEQETEENARLAEQEWQRSVHGKGLSHLNAVPVVNLRPSPSGINAQVRYVTRASERFEVRNRLYQRVIDLLQQPEPSGADAAASKA